MPQAVLYWFRELFLRVLPSPAISDEGFEDIVQEKLLFLKTLSVVRLCAEAKALQEHLEHTAFPIPNIPDLATLAAITRIVYNDYGMRGLTEHAQTIGYQACCQRYAQKAPKDETAPASKDLPLWPQAVFQALHAQVIQTLKNDPKAFLIAWQPSEIFLHQVCVEALETADGAALMTLYQWLLTRLADLFSGKASVNEGDPNPQDLWQSIADTQEMLNVVQVLWLKHPMIPVDYCDYLKTHTLFEKKEFFLSRLDVFRDLMAKA